MSFADAIVEQLRQAPYGWQYDWGKWLVLADWLEEHGRQPHATLIRKTHELETARLSRPARSVLIDQIDVLTRRHAPQWLIGAPPFHLTPDRCLWRNGFLSEVSVTWVPGIAPQLDRLLSHPAGMLIRHLRIDAGEHSIGPDGAATLAELEQNRPSAPTGTARAPVVDSGGEGAHARFVAGAPTARPLRQRHHERRRQGACGKRPVSQGGIDRPQSQPDGG